MRRTRIETGDCTSSAWLLALNLFLLNVYIFVLYSIVFFHLFLLNVQDPAK